MNKVSLELSPAQASALQWLLRHLTYDAALQSVPPHLGSQLRAEKAYAIVHAAVSLEGQLARGGYSGDHWMYSR